MYPVASLAEQAMKLLAADTTTLANATANKIALIKAPFTPGPGLVFASLTLADFDGSTPLVVTSGVQPEGTDPITGDFIIDLKPPVTGFRWEVTGTTNLPQTIYGFALVNDAVDEVLASALLPAPIALGAVNNRVELGSMPNLRMTQSAIS